MTTEYSGFWTTGGTKGDQLVSYDQAYWTYALELLGACNGREGVAPNYFNKLAGTVTGANTVAINTGGGLVDGKWYSNRTSQNVNIPSADSGNTRIDRIVLRADWANFNVSVYRIAGTQSTGTPTAPAITQTSGTTYDIMLYKALVNASGTVTLTDERTWAVTLTDETTLTSAGGSLAVKALGIANAYLDALSVTNSKIGLGAVHHDNMGENSVDSDQYVDGSIDLAHMSSNSIDSDQYVDGSIDHAHMNSNSIDSDQYIDNSIDYEHLSAGACKVTDRQGGSATEWNDSGTTDYVPTSARIQCGSILSSASGNVSVTYPVAFSYSPILFLHIMSANPSECHYFKRPGDSKTGFSFSVYNAADSRVALNVVWLAIGPV